MAVRSKVSPAQALVRKAAKPDESWVALYDENGQLLGITDPKNITPVANGTAAAAKPKAAPAKDAAAPAAAPQAAAVPEAVQKQRRTAALKKALYGGGTTEEQNRIAEELNAAAIVGLDLIQGRTRPRRH